MKLPFDSGHAYILAAALAGALLLRDRRGGGRTIPEGGGSAIRRRALQYLSGRYSGTFTILSAERRPDSAGPLPVFYSTFHWVLKAASQRFPDDTFTLRYFPKQRRWVDNYYTLLFRDEAAAIGAALTKEFFGRDCIAEASVRQTGWPDGIGDGSTLEEWLNAGGCVGKVILWFCDFLPEEESCAAFSAALADKLPNTAVFDFMALSAEGFRQAGRQRKDIFSLWDQHPDWRIGEIRYDCDRGKVMQSARYSPKEAPRDREHGA